MLKIKKISKSYSGKDILNNINFEINNSDKIGLIGINGTGKSTLLKIIAGLEKPDEGEIEITNDVLIGYLPQEINIEHKAETVKEFIKNFVGIAKIEEEMNQLQNNLDNQQNLDKFCEIQEKYILLDGYNFEYKLNEILNGLGLNGKIKDMQIQELSGGQKNKVLLASTLLKGSNLLLLDEPTNNMDLKSILWLEKFLNTIDIPYIIISHDRRFLDKVTNKTFEIDFFERTLSTYPGNYSEYRSFKAMEEQKQQNQYEQQQEKIKELTDTLKEKKNWAQKGSRQEVSDNDKYTRGYERDRSKGLAKQAKSIEKSISMIEKIDKPKIKQPLAFDVDFSKIDGSSYIDADNLVCGYENGFSTDELSFHCKFGERVVIIGNNASGKTTFLKTLLGNQKPLKGTVNIGSGLKIGYMNQDSQKEEDLTVEDYMLKNCKTDKKDIFTTLHRFNFDYEQKNKPYSKLSPGERTRLKLAMFSLNNINTLVLDEPTNHLDVDALEALEQVLKTFKGTIIAISHDREFIEHIQPNRILELKDGKFRSIEVRNIQHQKESPSR